MIDKDIGEALASLDEVEGIKFRSFAEGVLVGICIVQDCRIVYANPKFVEIAGRSAGDLSRKKIVYEMLFPDDREKIKEGMQKVLSGKAGSFLYQGRLLRNDGGVTDVEGAFTPTTYCGEPALIGTAVDVTEKKRLARQKTDFLAMVTHDFKTPLTSVMGYSELIASNEGLDKGTLEQAEHIQKSGRKLLDMVEDFLFHAQLESERIVPDFERIDPCAILKEVQRQFGVLAAQKKQKIEVECDEGLAGLFLDRKLMERALSNLVQNAINHTNEGGKITIRAGCNYGYVEKTAYFSVSDNGPGIPPALRSRIFSPYFRPPGSVGVRGAGLGLTIVKTVAEAHGGTVHTVQNEGGGTTFMINLPVGD